MSSKIGGEGFCRAGLQPGKGSDSVGATVGTVAFPPSTSLPLPASAAEAAVVCASQDAGAEAPASQGKSPGGRTFRPHVRGRKVRREVQEVSLLLRHERVSDERRSSGGRTFRSDIRRSGEKGLSP